MLEASRMRHWQFVVFDECHHRSLEGDGDVIVPAGSGKTLMSEEAEGDE
jgi:superfamily II DNA or RNA helicase